jgi:hypothetical protein
VDTQHQLKSIQTAAMSSIVIAKCGYNRKNKSEVIYGPTTLAEVGSVNCRLLQVALAWAQLSAGTSQPILTDTTTALPHSKVQWLHSLLRDLLKEIDAIIEIDQDQVPPLQRQYDKHIVDKVLTENASRTKKVTASITAKCSSNPSRSQTSAPHAEQDFTLSSWKARLAYLATLPTRAAPTNNGMVDMAAG